MILKVVRNDKSEIYIVCEKATLTGDIFEAYKGDFLVACIPETDYFVENA